MPTKSKLVLLALISTVCGFITFHYTEGLEYSTLIKLRDYIYFDGSRYEKDENGVVVNNYKNQKVVYNPVTIAQTALVDAQCTLSEKLTSPPKFHNCDSLTVDSKKIIQAANWFISNGVRKTYIDTDFIVFLYTFDYPKYSIVGPWISGMAQGQAIEVLLAAYEITGDKKYFSVAVTSANAFTVPLANGGVKVDVQGGTWYEEYASDDYENPPIVLNGHMYALDSLYWLKQYDSRWEIQYNSGVSALEHNVNRFYSAFWSYYDLTGTLANGKYHRIHIDQLERISMITPHLANVKTAIGRFEQNLFYPMGVFERLLLETNRYLVFTGFLYSAMFFILFSLCRLLRLRNGR